MKPRLGRTAAVIPFKNGKLALSKRTNTEAYSGYYQFPGGREDAPDEPYMVIAQRELLEEAGLDLPLHRFRHYGPNVHDKDCAACMIYFVFLDPSEELEHIEKDKCDGWQWFTPEEVKGLLLIEGMQEVVADIVRELNRCVYI